MTTNEITDSLGPWQVRELKGRFHVGHEECGRIFGADFFRRDLAVSTMLSFAKNRRRVIDEAPEFLPWS